jgi:hypothetical protein
MREPVVTIPSNQPLIGIPFQENGYEVIRYFSEKTLAERAFPSDTLQETLRLAGSWSDLSWEDMEHTLHRIRHESIPTPPLHDL